MAYAHAASFTVLFILFMICVVLLALEMGSAAKPVHLLSRIASLLVILSGAGLMIRYLVDGDLWIWSLIKMGFGLWLIASMEKIIVNMEHKKRAGVHWVAFCIGTAAVFTIGFTVLHLK